MEGGGGGGLDFRLQLAGLSLSALKFASFFLIHSLSFFFFPWIIIFFISLAEVGELTVPHGFQACVSHTSTRQCKIL